MKVLIIEDQKSLLKDIMEYLTGEQIICEGVDTYRAADEKISSFEYDVILMDLILPDGIGTNLISLIKEVNPKSAILIMTSKNTLKDKITGFQYGADDYLAKPFHLAELLVRIIALYRRIQFGGKNKITFEEIEVDLLEQQVQVNRNILILTQKEYELLLLFISNKNRVLGKNTIAEYLWGDYIDSLPHFDFIYQHIKNLKKKMKHLGANNYIKNVYGQGYKFTNNY